MMLSAVGRSRGSSRDRGGAGFSASYLYQFDYLLLFLVLLATAFGLIALEGATNGVPGLEDQVSRQMLWVGVGVGVFFSALIVPYRWLRFLGWPIYALLLGLLGLLLLSSQGTIGALTGVTARGAASWFELGPVRFQPSEFAKIAVVIVLAHWLAWRRRDLDHIHEAIPPIVLAALPAAIIAKQPDFGTAAVFAPLPFVLLFIAGIPWRVVLATLIAGFLVVSGGVIFLATSESIPGLSNYQEKRIRVFFEPITDAVTGALKPPGIEAVLYERGGEAEEESESRKSREERLDDWTVRYAEMALGSGEVTGKGWRKGMLSRLHFLPEHHTDFIYPALGEQFGLVGCLILLGLYTLIAWRSLHIAVTTPDPFGKYLVVGLLSVVFIHVFINIGVAIRLLPVTGIPLPLISYGGSFLISNFLIFGLIANVGMRRRQVAESGVGRS